MIIVAVVDRREVERSMCLFGEFGFCLLIRVYCFFLFFVVVDRREVERSSLFGFVWFCCFVCSAVDRREVERSRIAIVMCLWMGAVCDRRCFISSGLIPPPP